MGGQPDGQSEGRPARRVILHIDMNAFYCSVHAAVEPEKYRGKPTAVAGDAERRRGVVVTSSYEARARGVRTGMTVREALKACPELILIRPDFRLYQAYSRAFLRIASDYTPLVEAVSIDECYLDITGSGQFGTPVEIAREIRRRIRDELSLPCSIGIAPNKLLAKMASDMRKPDAITILRRRDVPRLLWDKPCDTLHGVGPKTAEKLRRLNIRTIGELAAADERLLVARFGVYGSWMKRAAHGLDDSPVRPQREAAKSVGHSTTLPRDLTTAREWRRVLLQLADQTTRRLRRQGMLCKTVQVAIRDPSMRTITRAETLEQPTDAAGDVYRAACRIMERHWAEGKPVRLLGVTLQGLSPRNDTPVQLDLFRYREMFRREKLSEVMDRLRDKYGEKALFSAGLLESGGADPENGDDEE
ncbi:MAG TPA: DNA polymerase IV [Paenibacillaceae bacterium]